MADQQIHEKVAAQFGPNAAAYVTSPSHANRDVLAQLVELTDPQPTDALLDIATGAGHVALAFAPRVAKATALDLTPAMLRQVEEAAKQRGLTNVETVEAKAEDIPFSSGSFDIVTARLAPHHFADVPRFLNEVRRVLKAGGKFLLVDTTVPEDDQLDREINHLELLRDPSHVRNYRVSEWTEMLQKAGFEIVHTHVGMHAGGTRMEVTGWMDRIGTPEENRAELLGTFFDPTPELVEALNIRRENDVVTFSLPEMTLLAIAG
jgi:ubiquinone/menaquinone biosynthesis C-methylase UbiE